MARQRKSLIGKYAEAAQGWQEGLARLGYPEAYAALFADAPPAGRVLDVGTGSGAFAEAFLAGRPGPARLDLVDPVPQMLKIATARLAPLSADITAIHGGLGSKCGARGEL